jgi:hypothetical protein
MAALLLILLLRSLFSCVFARVSGRMVAHDPGGACRIELTRFRSAQYLIPREIKVLAASLLTAPSLEALPCRVLAQGLESNTKTEGRTLCARQLPWPE